MTAIRGQDAIADDSLPAYAAPFLERIGLSNAARKRFELVAVWSAIVQLRF
ncbi:MAG: hypothetical protein JO093_13920 [Acidobacteria bacterium]|nr:hypothetical protein [Acidobacteriota bacterium]MBV9186712.1 hypothetical protein [Acidobacteriota bacterium]